MAGKNDKIKDKDRFSILVPKLDTCFICGTSSRICLHEVFHGTANRKKSKEDGLIIPLCFDHHQGTFGVHNNSKLDSKFKHDAEICWIHEYANDCNSPEEKINKFIDRYGKNFIDPGDLL